MSSAEEVEKEACLEDGTKQHLRQLHSILLASLRQREAEVLRFLGFVIPAFVGYVWLLRVRPGPRTFAAGSIGVMVLLFWGAAILTPWTKPKCLAGKGALTSGVAPELFAVHKWGFLVSSAVVWGVGILYILLKRPDVLGLVFLVLALVIGMMVVSWLGRRYSQKYDDLLKADNLLSSMLQEES